MLVLINEDIINIDFPEAHADMHWRRVFDSDPKTMPTSAILEIISKTLQSLEAVQTRDSDRLRKITDIASIVVTYTGANVAIFPKGGSIRITCVSDTVLSSLKDQYNSGRPLNLEAFWKKAA